MRNDNRIARVQCALKPGCANYSGKQCFYLNTRDCDSPLSRGPAPVSCTYLHLALRSQTDTIKEKGSLRSWNHWHKSSNLSSQCGPQTLAQRPGNILSGKSYLTHSCYKWGCLLPTLPDQGLWGGRGRQLWEMRTMMKSKAPTDRRDLDL